MQLRQGQDGRPGKKGGLNFTVPKKTDSEVLRKENLFRILITVLSVRPGTHWTSSGYFVVNNYM